MGSVSESLWRWLIRHNVHLKRDGTELARPHPDGTQTAHLDATEEVLARLQTPRCVGSQS
jgi:hypothetical protein